MKYKIKPSFLQRSLSSSRSSNNSSDNQAKKHYDDKKQHLNATSKYHRSNALHYTSDATSSVLHASGTHDDLLKGITIFKHTALAMLHIAGFGASKVKKIATHIQHTKEKKKLEKLEKHQAEFRSELREAASKTINPSVDQLMQKGVKSLKKKGLKKTL